MSIVERAIQKNRAEKSAGATRERSTGPDRALGRARQASAIAPELRIRPLPIALDMESCRQRRLLVGDEEHDRGTIAAYRMLRTRLLHRARTNQWTTIAITSAGPNDGKTLTALNLAFSMAREKSREIVLLDLDMRNPSVCRTLGVQPARQLRDHLESGGDMRGMFFSVGNENLLISGSTVPTDDASELLSSPRFDDLIKDLKRGTVDPIVLIDLPPVLVTDDALVVAPKIDAFLLVASQGFTARADLTKALGLLSEFRIAGVVLNRAVESAMGYDYSYEYGAKHGGDKDPSRG
ncbi:MAG TPA: CpsD/CapB family tyrosine-protein kinase [Steroidobacteraceae bacterium]|jgi:capsular exopolysaccharide synthesis family protein|nr:CpsD/CapB family tyrosine-protein kinase [Steroidobacteraceae bacterium]